LAPALLIVLAAASYGAFLYLRPAPVPPGLVYGNGHVEATEVRVGSEVAGRVIESRLVEGRTVSAGELLVRVDDTDLRIKLAQAEAERAALERDRVQLELDLATARHHVQTAESEVHRYRELQDRGTATPQRLEQVENAFEEARGRAVVLEARVTALEARLEAARQNVRFLHSQVEKTTIAAPLDATVLVKAVEPGELVEPGRAIAVLADLNRLELKVFVPEREIGKVRLGAEARVRADAFPERSIPATVGRVDQRAQFTPRDIHMPEERARIVFGITLLVDNLRGELKPGMPADAWIRWGDAGPWPELLAVPR
jgi:HlyD family secretion protein